MPGDFEWDETLYAGSARFYASGRVAYPAGLADALAAELSLDGAGRLLDVGCGPGTLTLLLAPRFAAAVGVDADPGMITEAAGQGRRAGCATVTWHRMRAEELPGGLGRFRLITFAQSFHWVEQPRVARAARAMIDPGGALALVHATTHEGIAGGDPLPGPRPPRGKIAELVAGYLGPVRRAGRGVIPGGPPYIDDATMTGAGFASRVRIGVGSGWVVDRTEDEVVASVFSLSSATPRQFGDRLDEFERELRRLLRSVSADGHFSERMRPITVDVWRP